MDDCIFCKIVRGEIPAAVVFENESVLAFEDIAPMAPVHIVVIPKAHALESAAQVTQENAGIVGDCFAAIAQIAARKKLAGGFRVVTNTGDDAGQTVKHLHFHILAGRPLSAELA